MSPVKTLLSTLRAAAVVLGSLFAVQAMAADLSAEVAERFTQQFQGVPLDGVTLTPYGLYELQVGGELLYTNETVSYVLQGSLIDSANRTNVTNARMQQLLAVPFAELPLELSFVQTFGTGARKMAIFEDPNCGYCKQLRQTLHQLQDVTLYTFMYPILSPDSSTKVESVWCAADKAAVWDAWMLKGETPPAAKCDAPLKDLVALGMRLRVRGTPTLIFEDGSRASGALPIAMLNDRLRDAEAP